MLMFTKHHPTVGAKCKGGFDKQVTNKQTNDQTWRQLKLAIKSHKEYQELGTKQQIETR